MIITVVLVQQWFIYQLDIKYAFMYGVIMNGIYVFIEQQHGMVDIHHSKHVCKLQQALYGLKQACCA